MPSPLPLKPVPPEQSRYVDWIDDLAIQKIMKTLEDDAQSPTAMFVGGCVRDSLLARPPDLANPGAGTDIDVATVHTPEEVQRRLLAAGIRIIPTGLQHGTVTALLDNRSIEITTLRADIDTDGRHATVVFTKDWGEDWRRRDFTINALYLTCDRQIFDPAGGLIDLNESKVRFIGDARIRLHEDYLRILRFYRFSARFARQMDEEGRSACAELALGLRKISRERIGQEFLKILLGPQLVLTLGAMDVDSLLAEIVPVPPTLPVTAKLASQTGQDLPLKAETYLAALCGAAPDMQDALRLSNTQAKSVESIALSADTVIARPTDTCVKELVYKQANPVAICSVALAEAKVKASQDDTAPDVDWQSLKILAKHWQAPEFPLGSTDFMAMGVSPGPQLGEAMRIAEQTWIDADYVSEQNSLQNIIKSTIRQLADNVG